MRNVEIKAEVKNFYEFLNKAAEVAGEPKCNLKQIDTYFKVPNGRLKLRQIELPLFNRLSSQLIFYDRPDVKGPKLSNYSMQHFGNSEEVEGLKKVLESSLGIIGIVKKKRELFIVRNTRIHIDDVEDLGHFMELEVMLRDGETVEQGQKIADELMSELGVSQGDLVSGSYIDL